MITTKENVQGLLTTEVPQEMMEFFKSYLSRTDLKYRFSAGGLTDIKPSLDVLDTPEDFSPLGPHCMRFFYTYFAEGYLWSVLDKPGKDELVNRFVNPHPYGGQLFLSNLFNQIERKNVHFFPTVCLEICPKFLYIEERNSPKEGTRLLIEARVLKLRDL